MITLPNFPVRRLMPLMAALCLCSACGQPPAAQIPANLPSDAPAYLDTWWSKGTTSTGQHLQIAVAASGASLNLKLYTLNLPKSDGWKELYRVPTKALSMSSDTLVLNSDVYSKGEATLKMRVNDELGGISQRSITVQDDVALQSGSKWDVSVVDSQLVVIADTVSAEDREKVLYSLVFSRAAAIAKEMSTRDTATYETTYSTSISAIGWTSSSSGTAAVGTDSTLLAGVSKGASLVSLLQTIGLLPPS